MRYTVLSSKCAEYGFAHINYTATICYT